MYNCKMRPLLAGMLIPAELQQLIHHIKRVTVDWFRRLLRGIALLVYQAAGTGNIHGG